MARMLCSSSAGGSSDLEQMQRQPGVGRKTANVLGGAVLWQKEVMPVDTHVFRVSERIGLTTRSKTPSRRSWPSKRISPATCRRSPTTG